MKRSTNHLADAPILSLDRINITKHARERILDMAVDAQEVQDCITKPRNATRSPSYGDWYYTRGRITLAVQFDAYGTAHVQTVLWAKSGGWRTDAAVAQMPKGRRVRRSFRAREAA